ncbi:MAG: glycoside hydrolase family 13 protein [Christensenellaceae bacterium]|jgi:4-alpha-glucanotransferase|nr:glycoside hydrolase family 13 protein [Christensenellaceae bacterium]
MEEGKIFHNSRLLRCRAPFGAAQAGGQVELFIQAPAAARVTLRLWVQAHEVLVQGARRGEGVRFVFSAEEPGLIWYYFILDTPQGRRYYGVAAGTGGEGILYDAPPPSWQVTVYDPAYQTPGWFCEGIAYQVFPDRFYRSGPVLGVEAHRALQHRIVVQEDWSHAPLYAPQAGETHYDPCDFYGGNLPGIREKLPYLAGLGVTCLYLNPIFLSQSNHRYNTMDYNTIDPILGDETDLAALTQAAGEYGIRVMLDGVFSHTGSDSLYFDAKHTFGGGACSDPNSPYRNWYTFDHYPDTYRAWWGFPSLPEVNELEPSYMAFVATMLQKYAALGVTSWRLDVADELPDAFLAFLRGTLKALDAQGVLLGEVWDDASNKEGFGARRKYVDGAELDSAMGYPFQTAVLGFMLGHTDAAGLQDRLMALRENYPKPFYDAQLNLLGSHDTIRAYTVLCGAPHRDALSRAEQAVWQPGADMPPLAKARLRLAALLQFSLPGVPCIYYGDEAGLAGMADPFNRQTYPWGQEDAALLQFYRLVTAARSGCEALKRGACGMAALAADVFAVLRCTVSSGALLVLNRSEQACVATVGASRFTQGPDVERLWVQGRYRDALTGAVYTAQNETLYVQLAPMQGALLIREGD